MPLAWGDIKGVSNDSRYAMRTSAKRVELLPPEPRPAYRTLEGWALGTLIEHGAVRECEHHGHMRDRADPEAWNHARDHARENPFPGTSAEASPLLPVITSAWLDDPGVPRLGIFLKQPHAM